MHPSTTTMPQVIDTLITMCQTATGLQVTDGAHLGEVAAEAICVGFTQPEKAGYTSQVTRTQSLGRSRLTETFEIQCFLSVTSGHTQMKALRDKAGLYLGQISQALAGIAQVDGVWDRANLGGALEWVPVQSQAGAMMGVFFAVEGAALL